MSESDISVLEFSQLPLEMKKEGEKRTPAHHDAEV